MLINNISSEVENIYSPIDSELAISEHYRLYPDHPWNKWKTEKRDDENAFTVLFSSDKFVQRNKWVNSENVLHRLYAPAVIQYHGKKLNHEQWFNNGVIHRLDGPALRQYLSSLRRDHWYLCGFLMSDKDHREIVSIYSNLGDWSLAFALSSFEKYTEKELAHNINLLIA